MSFNRTKKSYSCAFKDFSIEKLLLLKVHTVKKDVPNNSRQVIKNVGFKNSPVTTSLFVLKDSQAFLLQFINYTFIVLSYKTQQRNEILTFIPMQDKHTSQKYKTAE